MSFITFNQLRFGLLTLLGLLDPENGGTTLFEEICSYFPGDTASQPKNIESLTAPMWEIQILHMPTNSALNFMQPYLLVTSPISTYPFE